MKNFYFNSFLLGMMCLNIQFSQSQEILSDGDFSVTTKNISFDNSKPSTSAYFNKVISDTLSLIPEKVVIAGNFQDVLHCAEDWDPNCEYTELTFNSSTGLYSGTFEIPAGKNRYKVTVGGSRDINYGEDGIFNGADIFLCLPSGSEEITFTYDPTTHLVTTSPISSGFSPDCLPLVVLAGFFQDELGCESDWVSDCSNTALTYNQVSGLFEGDLNIPAGCYEYRVVLENNWQISFGQDGIHNGINYILSIPADPEITHFTYDPVSHVVRSSPYSDALKEVTKISLLGTLQDELGCVTDYDYECDNTELLLNPDSGVWESSFTLPAGCYTFLVKEVYGCTIIFYGENGIEGGNEFQLYVPIDGEITFSYDSQTHILSSTPYSGAPQELTTVSLMGTLQDELGCDHDDDFECNDPALLFNPNSGEWEGSFTLPAGCYTYWVKETFGCNSVTFYGENGILEGSKIPLYVPSDGEITFSYNPQTHIMSSLPYSGAPQEVTTISLQGSLQYELGCSFDHEYECNKPELLFNSDSGVWEGSFMLPAGCYSYRVKETFGCNIVTFYGENGIEWGNEIQLYVPTDGEITFSYDPQTHILSSSPYSGAPQEVTQVLLVGNFQDELGCDYDYDMECNNSALLFNLDSEAWEGSFTLPAGCYTYWVKETFGCNDVLYGENGIEGGNLIQLYVPSDSEISFSYDPNTHIISSTPYSGVPQEMTEVSLIGSLQEDLLFNPDSGAWEGSFVLSAGCYAYWVGETTVCKETYYGENGNEFGNEIQLYVPSDDEISFSYDPQTHIISTTPYSGAPQEATKVSLIGTFQDELGCAFEYDFECDNAALLFNPSSGAWEGSFTFPAGCYTYLVKETSVCNNLTFYGEKGIESGDVIQLYIPSGGEITFSYDPQTHIINSTPHSGASKEAAKVSLFGNLQDELGCDFDYDYVCDNPELLFNPESGVWEASFMLPAGCYFYWVKETTVCNIEIFYGENGIEWGNEIQLYVPLDGEITFTYDPQTHLISSTPYNGTPPELDTVSLIGTFQDELGCAVDFDFECDKSKLLFNSGSGAWEGSFNLPAGCYTYWVEETSVCDVTYYGENGIEYGDGNQLFVPSDTEITFSYDPQTHIISSSPYDNISTVIQCPDNISVNNEPGVCGAIVNYPEIEVTADCGGEILSVTQTAGSPSGSFFPIGLTTNSFVLTKTTGEEITCSFDIVVSDTESPVISGLNQSLETLWPPNHKMVPVFIDYFVSDNCNLASTEISISSNEPENGHGDGTTSLDWEILDEHNILLRAERSGKGDGREYYITIKVTDEFGNITEQVLTVIVSHDQGKPNRSKPDKNKFILYPNGADDVINLKELNPSSKSSFNSSYIIFDMLGIMKKKGTIINDQIEVATLPSGVYILKFETDEGYLFKKFIKN